MTLRFSECADLVEQLTAAVRELERRTAELGLPPVEQREWFETLQRKLVPQLGAESFLIVAVVGGTNIGKSVVFNHIAGAPLSSTSPLASGTKHPTAMVPAALSSQVRLSEIFPGFEVRPWQAADEPLREDARHLLFQRVSDVTAANLIVLDTPDIDSVAEVNWDRADAIRQSADVLVAVLTQQKYNDAAVKKFFRHAAAEAKLTLVVFNQCLLPEDEEYWPKWLETFCEETGVKPWAVYLAPNDRRAAETLRLPFFERPWPLSDESPFELSEPRNLLEDLSQLRFGEIKLQTLQGALRVVVDVHGGAPTWLRELERRARQFAEAGSLVAHHRAVEVQDWPLLPNSVLIDAVRAWWSSQREGWSATVHSFYGRVGDVVSWPVRRLREHAGAPRATPIEQYAEREWETVLKVLDRALDRLTQLQQLDHPLLSPRLEGVLSGAARAEVIQELRREHQQVDFSAELQALVREELTSFRTDRPEMYRLLRHLDNAAAAARPVLSVALFATGAGPLGDALAPVVANTAMQGVIHLAGDAVGGAAVTAVGDKVISESAASGLGYVEARLRRLHTRFAAQRGAWMAHHLDRLLLGALPEELDHAARAATGAEFQRVQQLVNQLRDYAGGHAET